MGRLAAAVSDGGVAAGPGRVRRAGRRARGGGGGDRRPRRRCCAGSRAAGRAPVASRPRTRTGWSRSLRRRSDGRWRTRSPATPTAQCETCGKPAIPGRPQCDACCRRGQALARGPARPGPRASASADAGGRACRPRSASHPAASGRASSGSRLEQRHQRTRPHTQEAPTMASTPLKAGVLVWNQYTTWPEMKQAALDADRLGYDSLWTWDHLYPIIGDPDGPFLEAYTILGAWSQLTTTPTHRAARGRQHVPQPGHRGQDGHDARPPLGRARLPGHRRGLVRDGAHGVRHRVRHQRRRAAGPAGRGGRAHARRCSPAARPPRAAASTTPRTCATTRRRCRRACRSSSAAAASARRSRRWRATPTRGTCPWSRRAQAKDKNDILDRWCEEVGRDPPRSSAPSASGPIVIRDDPAEARAVMRRPSRRATRR